MSNQFLNDSLTYYIEKDMLINVSDDDVIMRFQRMKTRKRMEKHMAEKICKDAPLEKTRKEVNNMPCRESHVEKSGYTRCCLQELSPTLVLSSYTKNYPEGRVVERAMEHKGLLKSTELYQYILETSVYPREAEPLKEIRAATASHPSALMAAAPDAGQMIAMLLKLLDARKTIEVGVFTGYSLLLTALTIPDDGKIIAIDMNRQAYEIGLPIIKKAGVEHKIDYIESAALPVLDKLLENSDNEGSFDFAFVDADKINYKNYHERMMKLLKVGGIVVYDNTLWSGTVVMPEELVPEYMQDGAHAIIELNKSLAADPRLQICQATLGDGITICKRLY